MSSNIKNLTLLIGKIMLLALLSLALIITPTLALTNKHLDVVATKKIYQNSEIYHNSISIDKDKKDGEQKPKNEKLIKDLGEEREKKRDKHIIEKYKKYNKYKKEDYNKAKEEYMKYMKLKEKRRGFGFVEAKNFIITGGKFAISYLERLKIYINNSPRISNDTKKELREQIDQYIITIEEKIDNVTSAKNVSELRSAIKDLKDSWENIRVGIKSIIGQIIVARLEYVIDRAEFVEAKLEERLNELKTAKDVNTYNISKLEDILNNYSEKIKLARESLEAAKNKFKEMKNGKDVNKLFKEGNDLLKEVNRYLKDAFNDVKLFFKEFIMVATYAHIFYGNKTGEVWVSGNGEIRLEGDLIAHIKGNGTLMVEPRNAIISVVGFRSLNEDGKVIYMGDGKVVIRGKDVKIFISGENIKLYAKGSGTLYLNGEGYYRVKKLPKEKMSDEISYTETEVKFGSQKSEYGQNENDE